MRYWESGEALTVLILLALLVGVELLARVLPVLRRLGLPLAIVAGTVGLTLGDQGLGLFSLEVELLEWLVYHGLAVVFIAVGLQSPGDGKRTAGARSMAFAIAAMVATQAAVGLAIVLILSSELHPGVGLLLPMGFEQGPGQALAMGATWEPGGLTGGAQLGLIIAVIGYGWSVVAGVPLVIWGRARGLALDARQDSADQGPLTIQVPRAQAGGLDALTVQAALIAGCYLLTWAFCAALAHLLSGMPDMAALVWGFHFIFGAGVAMLVRPLLGRLPGGSPVDDRLMARLGGLTVDVITAAALTAVQVAVLQENWFVLVLVTGIGGLWTLAFCVWMGRRAWSDAPFEHTVLWFGMSTGTLPTGLALLRAVDPELKSPAAVSAVFGSAGAVIGVAPLLMGLVPVTVVGFAGQGMAGPWPQHGWVMLAALVAYATIIIVAWRALGGLRFRRPLLAFWPD